jgi:hypothetical protein
MHMQMACQKMRYFDIEYKLNPEDAETDQTKLEKGMATCRFLPFT